MVNLKVVRTFLDELMKSYLDFHFHMVYILILYGKNLWRDSAAASKHRHSAISLCIVLLTSLANYTKIARSKRF